MILGFLLAATVAVPPVAQWLGSPPRKVDRIVSLAPSATEIIFALGAGNRVVGVTRYDNFPAAASKLPRVGGFIDPDPEAIVSLKPDMIVAVRTSGGRKRVDTLVRMGIPVLVVPAQSLDDMWIAIKALGDAVGAPDAAAKMREELRASIEDVRTTHANLEQLRALIVIGHRPLVTSGAETYLDRLLHLVAAKNVVSRGGAYPTLDIESVVALDPDVIIDVTIPADVNFWNRFQVLRAVKNGRVIQLNEEGLLRPGPRLPTALEVLAKALRPEAP